MYQTLIVSLNFTKIINWFFKSDWLITMLFQGQQRYWSRNMSDLVKSDSASRWMPATRGVMPIQSEGARALSDFWAKWILNAASKRQKIAD